MISVLLADRHDYTIGQYLASGGSGQAGLLRSLGWRDVLRRRRLPGGTYVLSDFERLRPDALRRATAVADALERSEHTRLLNHPSRCLGRYELLRRLHAEGANPYAVHRLHALPAALRFPVFVRLASDHQGARSGLLHTRDEIDAAARKLRKRGKPVDDMIVVEFEDTVDERGQYRKFGAFRVGTRIVPRHLFFGGQWCLKSPANHEDVQFDEEEAFLRENPHEAELLRIFDLAGVDFGRIDYALVGGRVCVWEINTNPMISIPEDATIGRPGVLHAFFHERFAAALRAIDTTSVGEVALPQTRRGFLARLLRRQPHT